MVLFASHDPAPRPTDEPCEKKPVTDYLQDQSPSLSENDEIDWTAAEETSLVRKLDLVVMPLLVLGFYALQLDRGNIGNALTDYFMEDVGITQFQFNVGQQLLSAGIVILEIPSNLVLFRIGPQKWISGQIVAWGLVATFQAFQKGLGAFMVTRILLGLCEAGFIPASLYTISMFYKRDETSKRFSIFFLGNLTAVASSGLIGYGILHMRGVANLAGWQWLFIIEGMFTCVVGILFAVLFPKSLFEPKSAFGIRYFTEREAGILRRRILFDDPRKLQKKKWIDWAELRHALCNWRVYPHLLLTLTAIAPVSTLNSYAPTLVSSFGYGRLVSNALVSVGGWISLVMNVSWGLLADHFGLRGPLVLLGVLIWWAVTIANRALIHSDDNHARYAVLTLALSFSMTYHAVNGSWLALNARSAGERSITMALFIMAANAAGIVGGQLFQASDKPLYQTGWTVIVALTSIGLVFTILSNLQYWWLNRGIVRQERQRAMAGEGIVTDGALHRYHQ
ncbi:alternative sulfate transporter [Diplodia corticola]|uniref:Alternative sulfate transporter n=1 Tax=Diplodia corticola TaxID=236234 RepID=A0A1J9RLI9_9PEZI|nr:alternative sulfate transporter [Diplodia corticola]OJD28788.1 alternative sulfate transporter [Diplodia corticola]